MSGLRVQPSCSAVHGFRSQDHLMVQNGSSGSGHQSRTTFQPWLGSQLVRALSLYVKVVGFNPCRDTCKRQPIDVSLSHRSLSLSPSLPLKSISTSSGEYKKRERETLQTANFFHHVGTPGEVQKRVLTRPRWHPDLRTPAPRTVGNKPLLFLSLFCYSSWNGRRHPSWAVKACAHFLR